jgi:hypothetical protein
MRVNGNSLLKNLLKTEEKSMDTRFAIAEYHDAKAINRELDELIKKPIYTIRPDALQKYEDEY